MPGHEFSLFRSRQCVLPPISRLSDPTPYSDWRREKARWGGYRRRGRTDDDPDLRKARQKAQSGSWIEKLEKLAAVEPELTDDQRAYVIGLVGGEAS